MQLPLGNRHGWANVWGRTLGFAPYAPPNVGANLVFAPYAGVNQSVISRRLRREGEVTPSRKYLHPVATFDTARQEPYPPETIPWDSCSWSGLGQIALWFTLPLPPSVVEPQLFLGNFVSYPRFPSLRALKVISVKEYTGLLVLLPSFLRCNDSYIVHYTPVIASRS